MRALFTPPPAIERLSGSPEEVQTSYRYWRIRQLYTTFIGYAVYYFVRKNISVAMPLMEKDLGISKSSLGGFLTLHDLLYGCSKFLNGMLADRSNPRYFMAIGLGVSAIINFVFGFSYAALTMGIVWMLNGWFQGMGFPPCARVLSHWFSPKERGVMWGIWNTSHMVGAAVILILAGYLGENYGWRWCFFGPGLIALVISVFLAVHLRDTPASVGLGPVEEYTGDTSVPRADGDEDQSGPEFRAFLRHHVFANPYIWLICLGNFFVYVVRYGFLNWAPTYLNQAKHIDLTQAGAMTAGFELAGLVGSLLAGYITDRYLASRRAPVCVVYMLGTAAAIFLFWKVPEGSQWLDSITLLAVGFLIYGPQFLVGVMTADLATKRAAATAIGLTGFFGYLSGVLSGYGLGKVVETYGWDGGFSLLIACALASAVAFAFCWNASPRHTGADDDEPQV
ncbi:MAG: MFS transporter [Vulcanimicrobiota bacterium]